MGPKSMPISAAAAFESASNRRRKPSSTQARATSRAPRAGVSASMRSICARMSSRAEDPLLDQQRDDCHLQDLVVGEGGVFQVRLRRVMTGGVHVVSVAFVRVPMVVAVRRRARVLVSAHVASPGTGSSQCS